MTNSRHDDILRQAFTYRQILVSYAYALTCDWNFAQDAFQEALIALHHKVDELDSDRLLPWMKRVTRNKAVDLIRKQSRQNKVQEKMAELIDSYFDAKASSEDKLNSQAEHQALYSCMQNLRGDARQVILDFYHNKKSCIELAEKLSRSENALRLLLSRTRQTLRSCIKNKLELRS
ncbi:sigma-70 family RNA polymerase sigma factor [Lentisphaera profundi]|uniref:Sigma-70 family RNA polymerase sigma factor n=1 Tax=Lentisphaera profundi TaxID=1658616 RepID=A0ABY7VNL3_9BACT|nr:sigma-70 family RNA polymerase sigma factor [Lentisphaera profundi]WDE95720.1 sigma-70 family RNA polymerase sigma factor [Lentisphaera profundi]